MKRNKKSASNRFFSSNALPINAKRNSTKKNLLKSNESKFKLKKRRDTPRKSEYRLNVKLRGERMSSLNLASLKR